MPVFETNQNSSWFWPSAGSVYYLQTFHLNVKKDASWLHLECYEAIVINSSRKLFYQWRRKKGLSCSRTGLRRGRVLQKWHEINQNWIMKRNKFKTESHLKSQVDSLEWQQSLFRELLERFRRIGCLNPNCMIRHEWKRWPGNEDECSMRM